MIVLGWETTRELLVVLPINPKPRLYDLVAMTQVALLTSAFIGLAVSGLGIFSSALFSIVLSWILDDTVPGLCADGVVNYYRDEPDWMRMEVRVVWVVWVGVGVGVVRVMMMGITQEVSWKK